MATTTAGDAPYEGGAGGKFQKRPFRRAPTTPYDRPASAARVSAVVRPAESHAGDGPMGGRWLSKLVNPASRIVAQGASSFFSSLFRKRLTSPPAASELNVKSREEVSNVSHIIQNSVTEVKKQNHIDENRAVSNHSSDGALKETGSPSDHTFELEQLLNQKKFTRFEFDHLMELLSSRTVEPSTSKPSFSPQEIEEANILEKEIVKQHSPIDKTILQSSMTHGNKDKEKPGPESGNSFGLHSDHTTPVGSLVLGNENLAKQTGSPAEIAKAYMGSRYFYRSPVRFSAQKQVFEEDKILYNNSHYIKKPFDNSVAPISTNIFGTPGLAKNSYMTPRITGKSATYRMPQSSHFKLPLATKVRAGSPSVDQNVWSSSSKWTSTSFIRSDGGQARKRGRSVLDDDISSIGPVRRLRQKCNAMVPSRYSKSSLKCLSSPLTSSHYHKFPNQKPPNLEDKKQFVTELNDAENGVAASTSIVPIPPQSSEMARRILEQLDKLKSSPKGKSSKLKMADAEESPAKLTYNMLHERALRSMEDVDSSKFLSVHESNQIKFTSDSHHEGLRSSSDEKQSRPKENDPLEPSSLGVQVKPSKIFPDVKSSMKSSELLVSNSSSSAQKKPSFCISIPEDSLDLDDDDYTAKDSSSHAIIENEQLEVLSEHESTHSEREKLNKVVEVSKFIPSDASLLESAKDRDKQVFDKSVKPAKDDSMFSSAPTSNNPPQLLPSCTTETVSLLSESSAPVKVGSNAFKVGLGFESAHKSSSLSAIADFSSPAGMNSAGSALTSLTPLSDFNSDKGDNNLMDEKLSKSNGNAAVPNFKSPTSSSLSTFAVSATATMGNGTPSLLSGTSSASIVSTMENSGTGVTPEFSTSTTIASSTSSSALTSGSTFSTFQFCSSHPIATPSLATANSDFLKTEGGTVKLSAFGTSSSIIPGISAAFSNADGKSSAFMSLSPVSSITTNSLSPAPSFCSSSGTASSSVSASLAPSGSTNSFFSFDASSQSSDGVNLSFPSTSLQTTSKSFGLMAGATLSDPGISAALPNVDSNSSAFTSSSSSSSVSSITTSSLSPAPSFCSSSATGFSSVSSSSTPSGSTNSFFSFGASQSSHGVNPSFPSTSPQSSKPFGFTVGVTLSDQGTQTAGDSHILRGSANQFGSLSSPIMFGANGSSSSGSSSSLFSSTTFAAKPSVSDAGLTFSTSVSSASSTSSTAFTRTAFSSSPGFSFTAPSSSSTVFGLTTTSSSNSSFSFSTDIGSLYGSGSVTPLAANPTNATFKSGSQTSPSTIFGSLGSSMSSPSTGFSAGSSTSSGSSFTFGASSVPAFSFGATGNATSSAPFSSKTVFGVSNHLSPMNSGSPGNDQMNVEDSMADDPVQAPVNTIPTFGTTLGQPTSAPATPGFVFGSPAFSTAPSTFQFGSQHGSSVPQNTSPFQPTGSLEFAASGSFSLGSGAGGDKSGRKFVRVRRDKLRKK